MPILEKKVRLRVIKQLARGHMSGRPVSSPRAGLLTQIQGPFLSGLPREKSQWLPLVPLDGGGETGAGSLK